MNGLPLSTETLSVFLGVVILIGAFCSASETGMMSLNRYRLKHLAKKEKKAQRITHLLAHPDRLIGVILIANTFSTAASSSLANEIGERLFGHIGIYLSPIVLTLVYLVVAEIMPKTVGALHPEDTARFAARPLQWMLYVLYPFVWLANGLSNRLLWLLGVRERVGSREVLTPEELRTMVHEASSFIPLHHKSMLLSILDLESVRVDHIMVPRQAVIGLDLEEEEGVLLAQLAKVQHTLLPVYRSDLDNVQGIIHVRKLAKVLAQQPFDKGVLTSLMEEPQFVPEGTSLQTQLVNFQRTKSRMALVVNEYGDVVGLVTLEDILEEIVGEFTTKVVSDTQEIQPQADGSFWVKGSINLRELNRSQQWDFPTQGPTTLSGLIIETLESIPTPGTTLTLAGYTIEVLQVKDNRVKLVRVSPIPETG